MKTKYVVPVVVHIDRDEGSQTLRQTVVVNINNTHIQNATWDKPLVRALQQQGVLPVTAESFCTNIEHTKLGNSFYFRSVHDKYTYHIDISADSIGVES